MLAYLHHLALLTLIDPSRTVDTALISGRGEVTGSDFRHGCHRPGHEIVRVGIGVHSSRTHPQILAGCGLLFDYES